MSTLISKSLRFSARFAGLLTFCGALAVSQVQAQSSRPITSNSPLSGPVDTGAIVNSQVAMVVDLNDDKVLYAKNPNTIRPIASISKLLTAYVVVRSNLDMNEMITITSDDIDRLKNSGSRLSVGTTLPRHEMLLLALMSSENRAAHALARTYPGGLSAFVAAMNTTARQLGMTRSRFIEPTGLSPSNISTPNDLVRLLKAVSKEPLIHQYTTSDGYDILTSNGKRQNYKNSNRLVRNPDWKIQISKTGYIKEAGECLVMITQFDKQPVAVVLLNAQGHLTRFADAVRVRHIVQNDYPSLY
ncbi:D-alanyl-D-alanine endopeptidase [Brackiella oedipodis]|uniref:D-alanyl-D-alanine endopeptidase n=1 Tax=Brackiella oedipodis TaxID=124225 RepID=UPI000491D282|nr:D-alanyl-D-alanine endopeptidase [Brackiella oedipodis]